MPEENTAVQECQRPELPHKVCAGVCSMYSFGDALLYQDVSSVNCTHVRFMVCIVFILLVCSSSIRGDVAVMFQMFLLGGVHCRLGEVGFTYSAIRGDGVRLLNLVQVYVMAHLSCQIRPPLLNGPHGGTGQIQHPDQT